MKKSIVDQKNLPEKKLNTPCTHDNATKHNQTILSYYTTFYKPYQLRLFCFFRRISAKDADALFEKVGVANRAKSEDWVGQAKAIVAGESPRAKVDQRLLVKMRAAKAANGEG